MKCYIYGIGLQYNRLSSYLKIYQDKIQVLALVTTEPQRISYLDGKKIIRPWEMKVNEMDYVIIAVEQYKEILKILRDCVCEGGRVTTDKILRSDIFSIPNFVLEDYLRLKKSKPTILANTCIGGTIYNDLRLEFLSPTIDMRCRNYIQFLKNYKYYLSIDIEDKKDDFLKEDKEEMWAFAPEGSFGDSVCWRYVHAENGTVATEKWNERRHRVNFDNIIALMIIRTDEEAKEFDRLPIERKLGFYWKDLKLKSVLYTPEWEKGENIKYKYYYWYSNFIHRFYVRCIDNLGKIDWIRFLNGEKDFLRF